jgi:hypothetical protein
MVATRLDKSRLSTATLSTLSIFKGARGIMMKHTGLSSAMVDKRVPVKRSRTPALEKCCGLCHRQPACGVSSHNSMVVPYIILLLTSCMLYIVYAHSSIHVTTSQFHATPAEVENP